MLKSKNIRKKKKKWEIFENNCFEYLIYNYPDCDFIKEGASNSRCSDIKVLNNKKYYFNIEAKMNSSQTSQFTLNIEKEKFKYSELNKNKNNKYSKEIIKYLNSNYDNYKNINQNSVYIDLSNDLCKKWILSHYKTSDIRFIITGDNSNKIILPIENIDKYFEIKCFLRRKKSGSRNLPKSNIQVITDYIEKNIDSNFNIFNINKNFYIEFNNQIEKDIKFNIDNDTYMISPLESKNIYSIRKLGKTNNPTVIFSLKLKNKIQDKEDLNSFLNCIKKDTIN